MMMRRRAATWDLVVIGGGTAGLVAAVTGAEIGARVLLAEKARTGGDCLWTGCVPSKTLLAAAATGDFDAAMSGVRRAISTIEPEDSPQMLRDVGATVVHGEAVLTGAGEVAIGGATYGFGRAVLATGSRPAVPALPGLPHPAVVTSDTVWGLSELPEQLLVVGGGPVGCELAQAFARLGSAVTVVEAERRLLPGFDPQASAIVEGALRAGGVEVQTGLRVVGVEAHGVAGPGGRAWVEEEPSPVSTASGAAARPFTVALLAVGREPRVHGMGLDRAGVLTHGGAVVVDSRLRTTNRRIFAAGDVVGPPYLTHVAAADGGRAATNALLGLRQGPSPHAPPRVVFTRPEVASVGERTWGDSDVVRRVLRRGHEHVDRAVADGDTVGFSALAVGARGRLVGATVVGPRAGETISELQLAIDRAVTTTQLSRVLHPYPTYNDGPWRAAVEDVREAVRTPVVSRALAVAVATRRRGAALRHCTWVVAREEEPLTRLRSSAARSPAGR